MIHGLPTYTSKPGLARRVIAGQGPMSRSPGQRRRPATGEPRRRLSHQEAKPGWDTRSTEPASEMMDWVATRVTGMEEATLASPGASPGAAAETHDAHTGGCSGHVCEF